MSLRSRHSAAQSSAHTTDVTVYQFALRVAYLAFLCSKPERGPTPIAATTSAAASTSSSSNWTASLSSLGDIFSSSNKEVKFPKELIKVLGSRLDAIFKGKDSNAANNAEAFRATVGVFYGNYLTPNMQRQLKENRKIEELIISFVTTAQGLLRKRAKEQELVELLMQQVGQFVILIRDCLKNSREIPSRHVPKELVDRLDLYCAKLRDNSQPAPLTKRPTSSSITTGASSSDTPTLNLDTKAPKPIDFEMIRQVARIFGTPDAQLAADLTAIKRTCTEKVSTLMDRNYSCAEGRLRRLYEI